MLRSKSVAAYRLLLRTAMQVEVEAALTPKGGLAAYISRRFRRVAEQNRKQKSKSNNVQKQLAMVARYCTMLRSAPDHEALGSMLRVLSASVGSPLYERTVEHGFVDYLRFCEMQAERNEDDEHALSDRQNRLLQHAIAPFAHKLALLHQFSDVDHAREALANVRSSVSVFAVESGEGERVAVEVDEDLNTQHIYIRCPDIDLETEMPSAETSDDTDEPKVVETVLLDGARNTSGHAEWISIAERLLDLLKSDSPLHRSRKTVVSGHGVGGSVGFALGLMLHVAGFSVKNVFTFGAPKVFQTTLERYVVALNPVRVVAVGDPAADLPETDGQFGQPFRHFGEILLLERPRKQQHAKGKQQESLSFSIADYADLLSRDDTVLSYAEGDEVWDDGRIAHALDAQAQH